ncbi:hypothetical protein R3P38DRAFT_3008251 [Favolaschia claudopus]|uniref:MYND-type domain-containing protein n=1 Tax=Favolaschia claudopus TaxID=2862362 RepID=A0AAW0AJ53_9AGAR
MHPILNLSNINRLPMASRKFATPLICEYPRYPYAGDILRFADALKLRTPTDFIALFYHLLDPIRLPTPEALDSWTEETACNLMAGATALSNLLQTRPHQTTAVDLWPRVIPWAQFLCTFDDVVRPMLSLSERDFHDNLMRFWNHFWKDHQHLIMSLPGASQLALRSWNSASYTDLLQSGGYQNMVHDILVYGPGITLPEILQVLDMSTFAQLLMHQCTPVVSPTWTRGDPVGFTKFWLFRQVIDIVDLIDDFTNKIKSQTKPKTKNSHPHPLCETLLPLGFLKPVVVAGRAICDTQPSPNSLTPAHQSLLTSTIRLIASLLLLHPGNHSTLLRTALRYGLMDIVLWTALIDTEHPVQETLRLLITDVLTPAAVYYHALNDLGKAHYRVLVPKTFTNGLTRAAWTTFVKMLGGRLRAVDEFDDEADEGGALGRRAQCDNVECGKIFTKADLQRCSGCQNVLYCSLQCQAADWHHGHRNNCSCHLAHRTAIRRSYSAKEYAFLRFLLRRETVRGREKLAIDYVRWQIANFTAEPSLVLTVYDYRSGLLGGVGDSMGKVEHIALSPSSSHSSSYSHALNTAVSNAQYWTDIVTRAARSSGCISLSLLRLPPSSPPSRASSSKTSAKTKNLNQDLSLLLPLRRTSSEIPDALRGIALRGQEGGLTRKEIEEEVREVVGRLEVGAGDVVV